jgi:molybdate transport system permease protein
MSLHPEDMTALRLTLQLGAVSTAILLLIGTPVAWWLARTRRPVRPLVEALVSLPLVLPPTVLGFYLLLLLGAEGPLGRLMIGVGGRPLAFTFAGLVIGSVIYSFPFVVQPLRDAFAGIGRTPLEAAATLGAGPLDRFFRVAVPLARRGFLTATTLGFAHTLGEFGVVLMIGGAIPGRTQVLSIALFDHVEALEYGRAHALAALLVGLSFALLLLVHWVNRTRRKEER